MWYTQCDTHNVTHTIWPTQCDPHDVTHTMRPIQCDPCDPCDPHRLGRRPRWEGDPVMISKTMKANLNAWLKAKFTSIQRPSHYESTQQKNTRRTYVGKPTCLKVYLARPKSSTKSSQTPRYLLCLVFLEQMARNQLHHPILVEYFFLVIWVDTQDRLRLLAKRPHAPTMNLSS